MNELGINTYGLSKCIKEDFNGLLKKLNSININYIEPCIMFNQRMNCFMVLGANMALLFNHTQDSNWKNKKADEYFEILKEHKIKVNSIHLVFANLVSFHNVRAEVLKFAKKHQIKSVVVSLMLKNFKENKNMKEFKEFVEYMAKYDIEVLYHNHHQEFNSNESRYVLDELLDYIPSLKLELDVGWVYYAGLDVIEIMKKYQDRIRLIHLKDFKKVEDKMVFTVVGEGEIPLKQIIEESNKIDLLEPRLIIDQDHSENDILFDIEKGQQNVRK